MNQILENIERANAERDRSLSLSRQQMTEADVREALEEVPPGMLFIALCGCRPCIDLHGLDIVTSYFRPPASKDPRLALSGGPLLDPRPRGIKGLHISARSAPSLPLRALKNFQFVFYTSLLTSRSTWVVLCGWPIWKRLI